MVSEPDNQEAVQIRVKSHGKSVDFYIDAPSDHIQASIVRSKQFYEIDLLNEVFHRTLPGMRFVDIGSNIGNHTLFFSGIAGMEGTAFEPYKPNFQRLAKNIKISNLDPMVDIHNLAVGRCAGNAKCAQIDQKNTGTISFSESSDGDVVMIALDDMELKEFHFLKIDVEGMEVDVLKGARKTLRKFRPLIFCEAQNHHEFMEQKNYLSELGYQPTRRFCVTPTYLFEPV